MSARPFDVRLRAPAAGDARALALAYAENRAFLEPFEPLRTDDFFTSAGQAARIESRLVDEAVGRGLMRLIEADGRLAGVINVANVAGWPFRNATIGYWVAERLNGRGIATAAIAAVVEEAVDVLGVRRLEAGTLVGNIGSQRALLRCGFRPFGVAPRYLEIAGAFRDHVLFQRLADEPPVGRAAPAGLVIEPVASRHGTALVARLGSRRVGRVVLRPAGDARRLNVRVAPSARRRGVASALVRAALATARSEGLASVEAHVRLADAACLDLLQACGFATVSVQGAGSESGEALLVAPPAQR